MKHLKMLGLGLVTAAALTALAGAGTASATVICKNNLNTEKCSEPYPVGTEGTASSSGSIILETTGGTTLDTCTGSEVKGTIGNAGSSTTTVSSKLSSITWTGCTVETKTLAPGSGELHWITGTDNGTLTTSGTEVTVNTGFFGACVYGTGEGKDMGTTVGGNPGSLTISTTVKLTKNESGLCPSELKFTGTYVATSPKNAWVTAG
jgi:hypothetical protein